MKKLSVCILLIAFCLSGCGKIEMTDTAIPIAYGLDYKNNLIKISAQIAKPASPGSSAGTGSQFSIITSSGRTISEATRNVNLFLSSLPLWSQVQVLLLSDTMAKRGIDDQMDFLNRNRFVRKGNTLLITKNTSPEQILNIKPYLEDYTGIAIRKLIKTEEKQLGIYKQTNLKEFLQKVADPGIEPAIPMITIRKNGLEKQLLLDGTAVFKDVKMIGILNETESRGYCLMDPKTNNMGLFLIHSPINQKNKVTLEISTTRVKVKPVIKDRNIKIYIELNVDGNFYEQSSNENLFTPKMFKMIEIIAERELKRQMNLSIKKAKALNCDIFGWGNLIYRQDPKLWKHIEGDWNELFPEIPYDLKVNFDLRRSYLTDKPFVFR